MKDLMLLGLSLVLLAGIGPVSQAQENFGKGRISGTVVDQDGAPLMGVLISAQSGQSKTSLQGRTDKKGRFSMVGLGSGPWRVTASLEGYEKTFLDQNVSQLSPNPPLSFVLKKTAIAATVAPDGKIQAELDRANALLDQAKYDEALPAFQELEAQHPEVLLLSLDVGTCFLKLGELGRAEAQFKAVLGKSLAVDGDKTEDPASAVRALSGLGEIAARRGDMEAAKGLFSRALELSPKDQLSALNIGEILFSNQDIDGAIKYYELAAGIKKDWSKPYLRLGYAYLNKGDYAKSLESFNKFLELDPQSPDVPQVKNIILTVQKLKK